MTFTHPSSDVQTAISLPSDRSCAAQALMDLIAAVDVLAIQLKQRPELPHAEHTVLDLLNRLGPLTVPQIARERCTSRQNIQILVDRLEEEGRVRRLENPAHKKSLLLGLTDEGKAWLEAGQKGRQDLLVGIGARMSESEVREAINVLNELRKLLSTREQSRESAPRVNRALTPQGSQFTEPTALAKTASSVEEFPLNLL